MGAESVECAWRSVAELAKSACPELISREEAKVGSSDMQILSDGTPPIIYTTILIAFPNEVTSTLDCKALTQILTIVTSFAQLL